MRHASLVFLATLTVTGCSRKGSLDLSYREFDQTPGSGWRAPAGEKKYREASALIDKYVEYNKRKLGIHERSNLVFHAGQLYAFDGDYGRAIGCFKRAVVPDEAPDAPVKWNAYVKATIAFISGDRAELILRRDEVAKGAPVDAEVPNLNIVDSFIRNFGRPYSEAYGKSK